MAVGMEVWAGIECSYNRVGDTYVDQLERTGLYEHPEALEQLAELGITAMRFPVLWERVCALGEQAWEWTDDGLERLRRHGILPIVGLMHHGSGPPHASLIDDRFASKFAAFARSVAERYPWVTRYTPINEPLTTARFATLYGLWHPHEKSARAFARAMVQQCRAISEAMRAIREVSPDAQLVQTEDLGKTYASSSLQYQADFENERRWLTFDLLLGRVHGGHPIAEYFRWAGVDEGELALLAERSCAPDVIGVNHYLTSERFLDDRLERYPHEFWGGNDQHRYADVEAVRVLGDGVAGPYEILSEAWQRYRRPVAVTEAQLACTREHQLRWLDEVWNAAHRLRDEGADVRAVTAWSAFGAHDWSSLLTRTDGRYEPGLFDIRAPAPRPTALAEMVRSLATRGCFEHSVLGSPGWWRRDRRLAYPPVTASTTTATHPHAEGRRCSLERRATRIGRRELPILVVGASGTLGRAVTRACEDRGLAYVARARAHLDITDPHAVAHALAMLEPWAVVNCAGFVRVDDAERQAHACRAANVDGAAILGQACASAGVKLVTFSTDLVFDGEKRSPYVESDLPRPLSEYGRTKGAAEAAVLAATSDALVVRTAAFFGDHDEFNFVTLALRALAAGHPFDAMRDVVISATYVPDLVNAVLDLTIDNERGIWHLTNVGALTWEELARRAADVAHVSARTLRGIEITELGLAAPRPSFSALASERASIMPSLDDALARYARSRAWERVPATVPNGARHGARGHRATISHHEPGARGKSRHEGMAGAGDER